MSPDAEGSEPKLFTVRSLDRINVEIADNEGPRLSATNISEFSANGTRKLHNKNAFRWFKKKTRSEKQMIIIICILLVLCIMLLITAAVLILRGPPYDESKVCRSDNCVASAALVMQNVDLQADPCDDFYQYACGNFKKAYPVVGDNRDINWFNMKRQKLDQEIKETMDQEGLKPILELLKKLEMPQIPTLFKLEDGADHSLGGWQWSKSAGMFARWAGIDAILGVYVTADLRNSSLKRIKVYPPSWSTPYAFHKSVKYTKFLTDGDYMQQALRESAAEKIQRPKVEALRKAFLRKVIEIVINETRKENKDTNIRSERQSKENETSPMDQAVGKLYDLETSLRTALNGSFREFDMQKFNLSDLQEFTDNLTRDKVDRKNLINWELLFRQVFEDTNVTTDKLGEILIYTPYISNMVNILANTTPSTVEALLWWIVANSGVMHTTKQMRNVLHDYVADLNGGQQRISSRSDHCIAIVNKYFGVAVGYHFADPGFFNRSQEKIGTMYAGIKDSFKNRVRALEWMDEATKQAVILKADTTKINIAFPKEVRNNSQLEKYYNGVGDFEKDKFLSNMIKLVRFHYFEMFSRLFEPVDREEWASEPMMVNAFYSMETNLITVPAGILRFPFFDTGLDVLNYGAVGVILGHELTHGFDNTGRLYDQNGNYRTWWANDTAETYDNKTTCFVKHYGKLYIDDLGFVDGRLTLGENIADNGGVRAAFESYQLLRRKKPDLKELLPGLEFISPEKLFFIFYAGWSCQSADVRAIASYIMRDPHSPNQARVWGAVSNSWIFAKTFGCDFCANMNPKNKCEIW